MRLTLWLSLAMLVIATPTLGQILASESMYGINAHVPADAMLAKVQAAGISWVRLDFDWVSIETSKGQFSWGSWDNAVNSAANRGLFVFATLGYTPAWANGGQARNVPATNISDWMDFVTVAVNRYKNRVHHWGLWNEPNLSKFFSGSVTDYINKILIPGADAIRAADATAFRVAPDVSSNNSFLETVLNTAKDKIDIITFHKYGDTVNDALKDIDGSHFPWENKTYKEILQDTGVFGIKPVWWTEVGWPTANGTFVDTVTPQQQADNYVNLLDQVRASRSWINKVFFYELKDDPTTGVPAWGILTASLSEKIAYTEYRNYIIAHPPLIPPAKATNSNPSDQATRISIHTSLSWSAGAAAGSHDIYFGTASPGAFRGNQVATSFNLDLLDPATTYFWRIDEVNANGTTQGDVWSFTTAGIPGDFDSDQDVDQTDFAHLQICFSPIGALSIPPQCLSADFNLDTVVDQSDFVIFLGCMSGPNVAADPDCAQP